MMMKDRFQDAVTAYNNAVKLESLADPDYIDAAIANTNAAKAHLDVVCKELHKPSKQDSKSKLNWVMNRAKRSPKGDYHVYNSFRRELEIMPLTSAEYQKAIIKLANILRV